ELAPRLNMDVHVGDAGQCETRCRRSGAHGAQKLSRDECAFNRALDTARLSGRNTGSCADATGTHSSRSARVREPCTDPRCSSAAGRCGICVDPPEPSTCDPTRRLPMRIYLPCSTASVIVPGCILLLASCDTGPLASRAPVGGVDAAQSVSGGRFAFVNFQLGATPGTVCPGSSACTNGAGEPAIRA